MKGDPENKALSCLRALYPTLGVRSQGRAFQGPPPTSKFTTPRKKRSLFLPYWNYRYPTLTPEIPTVLDPRMFCVWECEEGVLQTPKIVSSF